MKSQDAFRCDFSHTSDKDFDGWPDGWTRKTGPGLPDFVKVGIEDVESIEPPGPSSEEARPDRCLTVRLDGGGAFLTSPKIDVNSHHSLLATARIHTDGLVHDAAWVRLVLLDAAGSEVQSHVSPQISGTAAWQPISLGPITLSNARITSAVFELHVRPKGRQQDLEGTVHFDDIALTRLPRMELRANHPLHLYSSPNAAEIECVVSGFADQNVGGSPQQVLFELVDQHGNVLSSERRKLTTSPTKVEGFAGAAKWRPNVPDFGFYQVRAMLDEKGPSPLKRSLSLAVLRPLIAPLDGEFGWSLPTIDGPLPRERLVELVGHAGIHWLKAPLWFDGADPTQAEATASFAEQISQQGVELVGVLDQPPPEFRALFREPGNLPAASIFMEPQLWTSSVGPVLTRLSLKVRWWQLGADSDASYVGFPHLPEKIAEIKQHLQDSGQHVHLGIGWRWPYELPTTQAAPWSFLSLSSDPPLTADELLTELSLPTASRRRTLDQAAPKQTESPVHRWLVLAPLPRAEYSIDTRTRDLVCRMLAAKVRGAEAVFVPEPFHDEQGLMNADGSPAELLVPWRVTSRLVSGMQHVGSLQLPGGSQNHVFAGSGKAVVAIWNDSPTAELVQLGDDIEVIDLWGRSVRPESVLDGGVSRHKINVGPQPVFITGATEQLARLQVSAAFESDQLASVFGRQQMIYLLLENPFSQTITGDVTIHAPRSWGVDEHPRRFKIAEGGSLRLPIPVTLLADASSGQQPVRLDFQISADTDYRFSLGRTLRLGLDDVQLELSTRLRADGALIVEQRMTNLSDTPLSFQCMLFSPGRRRETRQVVDLVRGSNTLLFVLPNGEELLGQTLYLRAEEISGTRVLNDKVEAER